LAKNENVVVVDEESDKSLSPRDIRKKESKRNFWARPREAANNVNSDNHTNNNNNNGNNAKVGKSDNRSVSSNSESSKMVVKNKDGKLQSPKSEIPMEEILKNNESSFSAFSILSQFRASNLFAVNSMEVSYLYIFLI
jgi:hypothetical protein